MPTNIVVRTVSSATASSPPSTPASNAAYIGGARDLIDRVLAEPVDPADPLT